MSSSSKRGNETWDAELRAWGEAAPAPEAGSDAADQIMAKIEAGEGGATATAVSDDELFASPFPKSNEDGDLARGGRDRPNLKEIAKLAPTISSGNMRRAEGARAGRARDGEAEKDDSGIVDLAAAAKSDPHAAIRAQSTPLATEDLVPRSSRARASGPPSARERTSAAPAARGESEREPERARPSVVVALFITSVVALGSAAAAGVFYVKTRDAVSARPVAVAPAEPPPISAPPAPPPAATEPAPATPGADPNSLPPATVAENAKAAPRSDEAPAEKPSAADGRLATADRARPAAPSAGPAAASPATPGVSPARARGASGDLGSAMKKEVGGDDTVKTPAAAITGSADVPQRPSQGAVTGALGGVLPEARRCLGPDDPVSRAAIVFSSSGSVQGVTVTGPASGKPTEACIQGALSKARVQPFAEPSFTANITIRHL